MRPVETIPGMGGWGIKENDGGGEFYYDIKNFIPQCTTMIKNKV
jgi:hypothetical protein